MKIAQVSPLFESVPPKLYGGTERVVSYLTEELIQQGHKVTLFASGDSKTSARLISHVDEALRLNKNVQDSLAHHVIQMQEVIDRVDEFDVIHFHTDYIHFPFSSLLNKPHVTTLHGRLDIPDLVYIYRRFKDQPLVSISNNQRKPVPHGNWVSTIYHGLPNDLYSLGKGDKDYVAFIGRISPEKGLDVAIEIARQAGYKIKIAAKIDKVDQIYFDEHIKKLFDLPHVEYVGEISDDQKGEFIGGAKALLFPIQWPEPFGMVMIEAMACGTPVIAFPFGSVPEVIADGKTGFIVKDLPHAVKALQNINKLDRKKIRDVFEEQYSVSIMAANYVHLYEKLCSSGRSLPIKDVIKAA